MSLARARQRMNGLGVEDDEVVAPAEGDAAPVVSEQAEETVDSEVMEVTDAAEVVENHEEATAELEEAAATLEAIHTSLSASLEDGGLDPKAVVYMNLAVDSTLRRVGVKSAKLPSLETYGGATGRLASTKASLEGVSDWLKKIWTAIKNAVLKAIEAVKAFFSKLFGGIDKIEERAKKLLEEAAKMKGEAPKEKITFRSVGKLHTKGKADAKDFKDGLDNLALNVSECYDKLPTAVATASAAAAGHIQKLQSVKSGEDANKIFADMANDSKAESDSIVKAIKDKAVMSGGVVMRADKGDTNEGDITVTIAPAQKFSQIAESQEMDALNKEQVTAMLNTVVEIGKVIKTKKDVVKKAEDATEAAVKDYEKAVEAIEKDKGGVAKFIDGAKLKWALRQVRKKHLSTLTSLTGHAFGASRAALVLCEKSIAAYGTDSK